MPPKQNEQTKKLEELIERLEDRLAIFNESELKQRCAKVLVDIHQSLELLESQHQKLYELLGLTYADIHYSKE